MQLASPPQKKFSNNVVAIRTVTYAIRTRTVTYEKLSVIRMIMYQ